MANTDNNVSAEKLLDEGLKLYGAGKFEEAAEYWKKVLEISPDDYLALEYLEVVKEDLGKGVSEPAHSRAIGVIETAKKPVSSPSTTPDLAASADHKERGVALMSMNKFDEADRAFKAGIDSWGDDSELHGHEALALTHRYAKCREVIGDLSAVPQVAMSFDKIKNMDMSKEAGFIFSLVDGIIPYEDILTLARMDRLEAMCNIMTLIEKGVIK